MENLEDPMVISRRFTVIFTYCEIILRAVLEKKTKLWYTNSLDIL